MFYAIILGLPSFLIKILRETVTRGFVLIISWRSYPEYWAVETGRKLAGFFFLSRVSYESKIKGKLSAKNNDLVNLIHETKAKTIHKNTFK